MAIGPTASHGIHHSIPAGTHSMMDPLGALGGGGSEVSVADLDPKDPHHFAGSIIFSMDPDPDPDLNLAHFHHSCTDPPPIIHT